MVNLREYIRFISIIFLMIIIIMNYFNYDYPKMFKYGLIISAGLYLLLLFKDWIKYK